MPDNEANVSVDAKSDIEHPPGDLSSALLWHYRMPATVASEALAL